MGEDIKMQLKATEKTTKLNNMALFNKQTKKYIISLSIY